MHVHRTEELEHDHVYLGDDHDSNARRTLWVVALTIVMMIGEIIAGTVFGSMALLADGWHMATHAGALGITALAYAYARRNARNPRFTFGTGKVGDLAGFSSALLLGGVSILIAVESFERLVSPVPIAFSEAILVASIGLGVNLVSAWLLAGSHGHDHDHDHLHDHDHDHDHAHDHGNTANQDHNLRGAYLHVIADALTSVLAIAALVIGRYVGWVWLDPMIGVLGAIVIARWSLGLMRDTGAVLLDVSGGSDLSDRVRKAIEMDDERITDLHVWRVGPGRYAAVIALVAESPREPEEYKARLASLTELVHVSIEPHRCPDHVPTA